MSTIGILIDAVSVMGKCGKLRTTYHNMHHQQIINLRQKRKFGADENGVKAYTICTNEFINFAENGHNTISAQAECSYEA